MIGPTSDEEIPMPNCYCHAAISIHASTKEIARELPTSVARRGFTELATEIEFPSGPGNIANTNAPVDKATRTSETAGGGRDLQALVGPG